MTELVWKAAPVQSSRWRLSTAIVFVSTVLVVLALPPVLYAWLSYVKFGLFKPSYYVPYEAFLQTLRAGSLHDIWEASFVVINMTSGLLLSNLYALTVGQFVLSLLLGIAIALNLLALLVLRRACSTGRQQAGRAASAAGTSLFATVAASSTGIFGCCGGAAAGGVLALAGVSSTTAIQIAQWSPYIQVLLIGLFVLNYLRFRGRTRADV